MNELFDEFSVNVDLKMADRDTKYDVEIFFVLSKTLKLVLIIYWVDFRDEDSYYRLL